MHPSRFSDHNPARPAFDPAPSPRNLWQLEKIRQAFVAGESLDAIALRLNVLPDELVAFILEATGPARAVPEGRLPPTIAERERLRRLRERESSLLTLHACAPQQLAEVQSELRQLVRAR